MTNREYIKQRLNSFEVSEAMFIDAGIDPEMEYVPDPKMDKALIRLLEELILMPSLSNVSENGFSMSWDRDGARNWYLLLCKRNGITPDTEIVSLLGVSSITDISDIW